ncbi:MAG: hypothetical protein IKE62_00320 [Oscillospiraceae bacterium]|nr:hypothetical protein [Oscillospiraceae bacterium]
MTLSEKVAYIKGLADGMELDESKKEVRLMMAIIDVLEETAISVEDLEEAVESVCDEIDDIEDVVFDDDDECSCCDDDDDDMLEVKCPKCGEVLELEDEDFENGWIKCPACGEKLEFDVCDDDCDCCD